MSKAYSVSLYYRLFLVFGVSFVSIIAVLCIAISTIVNKDSARHLRNLIESAAPKIATELGPLPSAEHVAEIENKYGIDIDPLAKQGIKVTDGASAISLQPSVTYLDYSSEETLITVLLTSVLIFGIVLLNSFLVRRVLSPIAQVTNAASEYAEGRFATRVKNTSDDEIGSLSRTFDSMADRIQAQLDSLRHMAIGVSHEIRSPLARMRLAVENTSDPAAYRLLTNEIQNIDKIVEFTLERESLDTGLSQLVYHSFRIDEMLEELANYYRSSDLEIYTSLEAAELDGDRRRLEMLFKNLLDNCFEHGRPPVELTLTSSDSGIQVCISDSGAGLGESKPGIGLTLCESIARAHRGNLTMDSDEKKRTRVSVHLPRLSKQQQITSISPKHS